MNIRFRLIGGACWLLEIDDKVKIACDPVLAPIGTLYDFKFFKSKRVVGPVYNDETFDNVDIWLITHDHSDHIDNEGISKISHKSRIYGTKQVSRLLSISGLNVRSMSRGDTEHINLKGFHVSIEAVEAKHGSNILSSLLAGNVNGYYLTVSNRSETKKIYITGDTVYKKSIISYLMGKDLDIMIANMGKVKTRMFGGPLTLSKEMLDRIVSEIKPSVVIPVHIDDLSHYESERDALAENYLVLEVGETKVIGEGQSVPLI